MFLLIITIPLLSCQTLQKSVNLEWTQFPDPINENGEYIVTFDKETESVKMPLWYWKKITKYVIDTETNISILKDRESVVK